MPVLNRSFLLCFCAVKGSTVRVSRLIIQPHLCFFHLSPAHSLNCFVPCLLFSLLSLDHLFHPQVVLVPGLYPTAKTQKLASSLPLTPFLPCLKCAASQDSHCPAAWMPLFGVVRVTDSGVAMSPSAQVGLRSRENVLRFGFLPDR